MSVRVGVRVSRGIEKSLSFLLPVNILRESSKPRRRPRNAHEGILSPRILIPIARTAEEAEEVGACRCHTAVILLLKGPAHVELLS